MVNSSGRKQRFGENLAPLRGFQFKGAIYEGYSLECHNGTTHY
jgi:hypothetical protein